MEARRQLFHFIAVGMPDGNEARKVFKEPFAISFNFEKPSFTFRALVTFARRQPFHQPDGCAKGQGHLLMSATDTENGPRRVENHLEKARQRLRRVKVPRVALATENDVRRRMVPDALEGNILITLCDDIKS